MVVGHRADEQQAAQPHHLHVVGNSDRKIEDVLDGPRIDHDVELSFKFRQYGAIHVVNNGSALVIRVIQNF